MAACEPVWIHEPEALRGNWRSLMTGCRELRVEVGCGKGKFTVSYQSISDVSGYQIRYSTNKQFNKSVKIVKAGKT